MNTISKFVSLLDVFLLEIDSLFITFGHGHFFAKWRGWLLANIHTSYSFVILRNLPCWITLMLEIQLRTSWSPTQVEELTMLDNLARYLVFLWVYCLLCASFFANYSIDGWVVLLNLLNFGISLLSKCSQSRIVMMLNLNAYRIAYGCAWLIDLEETSFTCMGMLMT